MALRFLRRSSNAVKVGLKADVNRDKLQLRQIDSHWCLTFDKIIVKSPLGPATKVASPILGSVLLEEILGNIQYGKDLSRMAVSEILVVFNNHGEAKYNLPRTLSGGK